MKVIILAGGQGMRFWPLSSKAKPKQFLSLYTEETMLQLTYNRFRSWIQCEKVYVVTTENYLPLVLEQLPEIRSEQIILEPSQRDTAPCIALTALHFLKKNDDEALVMVPSDQYIDNSESLQHALTLAEEVAQHGESIITLGIAPTGPETGYGYIKAKTTPLENSSVYEVEKFIEKPDSQTAEKLVAQENIFWNSGIFIWKPSTIASHFKKYQPVMWKQLMDSQDDLEQVYSTLNKVSIDYAILEKAENVYTVPVTFNWDDVGTWTSLERMQITDDNDNYQNGDVLTSSVKNCIVYTDRKTMLIGVKDLIIASTEQGLLVCHKSEEQMIKKLLNNDV